MSSANARVLIEQFTLLPARTSGSMEQLASMLRNSGSIANTNREELNASPCFTPLSMLKDFDIFPFT